MRLCKPRSALPLAILALLQIGGGALAQAVSISRAAENHAAAIAFWTPDRMRGAKPLELNVAKDIEPQGISNAKPGRVESGEGSEPTLNLPPLNVKLFEPLRKSLGVEPDQTGTAAPFATFTTSRVFPDSAVTTYPWRATGKVFFHDPRTNEDFFCSASVLRPRIVVTAGHCVYHPRPGTTDDYSYTNWVFMPAYRSGIAPFCQWSKNTSFTSSEWRDSDGNVPNAQDVSIVVMNDRECNGSAAPVKIGSVTGYYGYKTNALLPQNITEIGYPANIDSGERMQATFAESFDNGGNNTVRIGSAMRGGSGGGPWLKDFGISGAGQPGTVRNQLVSVTSYGSTDPSALYQGGSMLDSRFTSLLSAACGQAAGNCQ